MDRATKLIVFVSNLVAVWLLARLVGGKLPPVLVPAGVAFAVSWLIALLAGDIAVTIVLSLAYFVPALCFAWFKSFVYLHYAIWLAALCGAMLPRSVRSRWAFPARWRAPLAFWALALALSWPIILLREVDFVPALRDAVYLSNSRLGVSPPAVASWILSVVSIATTGLLLLDWLFLAYPAVHLRRFEQRVIWPMFAAAAIAAAFAVYQTFVDISFLNGTYFWGLGRAVGTMRDANAFGMVVALWVPVAAALVFAAALEHRYWIALSLVVLAIFSLAVWGSGSRTALLGATIGLLVWFGGIRRSLSIRQALASASAVAVLVAIIALAVPSSTIGPWRRIVEFVPNLSRQQLLLAAERLWSRDMYGSIADQMIAEHPLVGIGVGGYNYQYADVMHLIDGTARLPSDNAQNWFRQQLAELGLLGSAGWIMWTGLFLWQLVRCDRSDDRSAMAGAVKGAVIGLGVASLLGVPTQDTAVSISFVVLAAWCLKLTGAERPPVRESRRQNLGWAAMFACLFGFLVGTAYAAWTDLRPPERALRADFPYQYGFSIPDKDDPRFRWTTAKAVDVFHADKRWLKIVIGAVAPDAAEHPVRVKVWFNDELILRVDRRGNFPITKYIRIRNGAKPVMIQIEASRTWRPVDFGLGEDRGQRGVAVKNWEFTDEDPPKGSVTIE